MANSLTASGIKLSDPPPIISNNPNNPEIGTSTTSQILEFNGSGTLYFGKFNQYITGTQVSTTITKTRADDVTLPALQPETIGYYAYTNTSNVTGSLKYPAGGVYRTGTGWTYVNSPSGSYTWTPSFHNNVTPSDDHTSFTFEVGDATRSISLYGHDERYYLAYGWYYRVE